MGLSEASLSNLKAEHNKKLGDTALQQGNFKDAWTRYSQALHEAKDFQMRHRLLANRSLAYCKARRYQAALQDANKLIEGRSGWDKAWFRRGNAFLGLQQTPAAVTAFRKAFYLSQGDAVCQNAMWKAVQRLTLEELGGQLLDLSAELETKEAISAAKLEVAEKKELVEAWYMQLKPTQESKSKLSPFYQQYMQWATKGLPAASALIHRSIAYANAKCFLQAVDDAKGAIARLQSRSASESNESTRDIEQKSMRQAYEALGGALLAEPNHVHEDVPAAVKALVMAMEHAPEDQALRDKLQDAEQQLSATQRSQVQSDLYNSGKSAHAAHLVQGLLNAPQPDTQVFKLDVTVLLPKATMKDVSFKLRTQLRTMIAAAANIPIAHVHLDSVRHESAIHHDASKLTRQSSSGTRWEGNSAFKEDARTIDTATGLIRGAHDDKGAGKPYMGAGVSVALVAQTGPDVSKAHHLLTALQDPQSLGPGLLDAFPDAWAMAAIVDITPAAVADPAALPSLAGSSSHDRALVPARPPTELSLPYGAYRLVGANGEPVERLNKHPFCMARVYYDASERPAEVWAEMADGSCRWRQTGSEVKVIALQVPQDVPARDLAVTLDPHHVKVLHKRTGEVYLQGQLWRGIVPQESVWMHGDGNGEDGFLLLLRKMNLELLTRHWLHSEMWWTRLFHHHSDIAWDDYEKDYSDLPAAILKQHHAVEAKREAARQIEAAEKSVRDILEERNDVRKRTRQERLNEMRTGVFWTWDKLNGAY